MTTAPRRGPFTLGLVLLGFVLLCGILQAQDAFAGVDHILMRAAGDARAGVGQSLTPFAILLSQATDVSGRFVMLALLALLFRRCWRQWLWLAGVTITAMLLNMGLKHLFAAQRPDLIAHLDPTMTYSFPSGHASGNMAFFGALAVLIGTRWGWITAVPLILLIGISRVLLGVHWPSDVICGWIEGVAILLVANLWKPSKSQ